MTIQDSIVLLRMQRNALSSISILPPEIITRIFRQSLSPRRRTYETAVKISHVCHQWREIARADPFLWAELTSDDGPEQIHEFLRRSKSISLDLIADFPSKSDLLISLLEQLSGRIASLDVAAGRREGNDHSRALDWFSNVTRTLTSPAPLLKRMHLHFANEYTEYASILQPTGQQSGAEDTEAQTVSTGTSHESASECTALLQTINLPLTCNIVIHCDGDRGLQTGIPLATRVRAHLRRLSPAFAIKSVQMQTLFGALSLEMKITSTSRESPHGAELVPTESQTAVSFEQSLNNPEEKLALAIYMLHSLPLYSLRDMEVTVSVMEPSQREMYDLLCTLSTLERLKIEIKAWGARDADWPRGCLSVFELPPDFDNTLSTPLATQPQSLFLPNLAILEMDSVMIRALPQNQKAEESNVLYRSLFSANVGRNRFRSVVFENCAISSSQLVELRTMLPHTDITVMRQKQGETTVT
ncbi:hypothetical protein K488DRAFT_83051 [Vararia minispora EC-137]|uniref:Uncharacterized protein n=1 Tax=Vararia minispora EC-137 TaxID=1314806 RepID=A0ACB8QUI4_9AGAM|nr:hypothetical protein K488DRAFT_83051 [Vararia minispora EC-137]